MSTKSHGVFLKCYKFQGSNLTLAPCVNTAILNVCWRKVIEPPYGIYHRDNCQSLFKIKAILTSRYFRHVDVSINFWYFFCVLTSVFTLRQRDKWSSGHHTRVYSNSRYLRLDILTLCAIFLLLDPKITLIYELNICMCRDNHSLRCWTGLFYCLKHFPAVFSNISNLFCFLPALFLFLK